MDERKLLEVVETLRQIEGWWDGEAGLKVIIEAMINGHVEAAMRTALPAREEREEHYLMVRALRELQGTISLMKAKGAASKAQLEDLRKRVSGEKQSQF